MLRASSLLVSGLFACFSLACGDDCSEIGCGASLIVELAPEGDAFADGAYELTLVMDEGTASCSFTMTEGSASMMACTGDAQLEAGELPTYMLVYAQGKPDTLSVTLTRDGSELAQEEFSPDYEAVDAIDSDACGGPCTAAQVSLAF